VAATAVGAVATAVGAVAMAVAVEATVAAATAVATMTGAMILRRYLIPHSPARPVLARRN
jgi:hypothetical protein